MMAQITITDSDLENILLWYHKAFHKKDDCSTSEKNTLTKLEALLIVEQEKDEMVDPRVIGGFRHF